MSATTRKLSFTFSTPSVFFAIDRGGRWLAGARHVVVQDLDRDLTFQLRVCRAIDLPHPAFANLRGDFVYAETSTGGKGQVAGL